MKRAKSDTAVCISSSHSQDIAKNAREEWWKFAQKSYSVVWFAKKQIRRKAVLCNIYTQNMQHQTQRKILSIIKMAEILWFWIRENVQLKSECRHDFLDTNLASF